MHPSPGCPPLWTPSPRRGVARSRDLWNRPNSCRFAPRLSRGAPVHRKPRNTPPPPRRRRRRIDLPRRPASAAQRLKPMHGTGLRTNMAVVSLRVPRAELQMRLEVVGFLRPRAGPSTGRAVHRSWVARVGLRTSWKADVCMSEPCAHFPTGQEAEFFRASQGRRRTAWAADAFPLEAPAHFETRHQRPLVQRSLASQAGFATIRGVHVFLLERRVRVLAVRCSMGWQADLEATWGIHFFLLERRARLLAVRCSMEWQAGLETTWGIHVFLLERRVRVLAVRCSMGWQADLEATWGIHFFLLERRARLVAVRCSMAWQAGLETMWGTQRQARLLAVR
mmetsp:Transcript_122054/g.390326  ORF Transcript_122054/g.390326 Transcript_122054/m.390326 type:complete len:337 (+) Transcript_122054:817-1827(+)